MTSYKLFKYVGNLVSVKKFIAFFPSDAEIINFFNNPYELRHHLNISETKHEFKSILEIQHYVSMRGGLITLEEQ
jgi:hypothetical protein